MTAPGRLVLVATPIGNLGDLSPRAVEALAKADAIACEDTRRTGRLLAHAGVNPPPLLVVNEHTEARRIVEIVGRLGHGERVAVVSDAGTPGVSDPGERLVRAAIDAGHLVEVVPGPSAVVAALVASGLATGRFCFEGFLPRKGSGRTARLDELARERRTIVLYEAPHRLLRTVNDLAAMLGGGRRLAIARELTKLHEEIWRGTLDEARGWVVATKPRGELVLVVDGAHDSVIVSDDEVEAAVAAERAAGATRRDAAATVAARLGVPRRRAYDAALGKGGVDAPGGSPATP
jgi:16S rRNA (cytidine1402-2'-O)-methyltransferase